MDNSNYYSPGLQCFTGLHIFHCVIGAIMAGVLLYIMFTYTLLAFDIKYNPSSFTSKHSAINDIFALIEAIIYIFLRELVKTNTVVLFCYFIISSAVALLFFIRNPYYSIISQRSHLLFHLLISWNMISVILGQLLIAIIDFVPLILFILGFPIIVLYSLFYSNNIILIFNTKEKQGFDYLYKSLILLDYIEQYNISREKEIVLDSYLAFRESECYLTNCQLKQHITESKASPNRNIIHLLLFVKSYFQEGMKKYPNYTLLRIYYAIFLFDKLNKPHQAMLELNNASRLNPSCYERYIIHKCRKEFDPSSDNVFISEISNSLIYLTNYNQFKDKMVKASQLYLNFWNWLNLSNQENKHDISKLSLIGHHINTINEELKNHFDLMQEINPNDKDILKYYSDYCTELLNDTINGKKYSDRYIIIAKEAEELEKEDIVNINLCQLTKTDTIQYIILSLECNKDNNTMGNDINSNDSMINEPIIKLASLGICETLGYNKKELNGRPLNIIIPEILRVNHNKLLAERMLSFKNKTIQSQMTKFQYKTIDSFALSKSRYIIPIFISPGIIPNEFDDYNFIAKITFDELFFSKNDQCYVLTDNYGIITNFSSSAISLLSLNSNDMKNNEESISIYDHISEAVRENDIGENESVCLLKRKKKKEVFNHKYNIKEVKWAKKQKKENSSKKETIIFSPMRSNNQPIFYLREKIVSIQKIKLGVLFQFELKRVKETHESSIRTNLVDNVIRGATVLKKNTSNGNVNLNANENEINSGINKDFIPETLDHFIFDFNQDRYCIEKESNNQHLNDLLNQIKMNDKHENTSHSSKMEQVSGSYSYSNSYTSNDDEMPMDDSEYNHKESFDQSGNGKGYVSLIKTQIANGDYYNINMKQIRYLIFNYETNQFDPLQNYEKQSQVEQRLNEYNMQYKDVSIKKLKTKQFNKDQVLNIYEIESNEKITYLLRQLTFALGKYEKHEEITILKFISLIVILIAIGEGIFCLLFFIQIIFRAKEIDSFISSTYDLLTNAIVSTYLVRELSLLYDTKYTLYYIERDLHRMEVLKEMLTMYYKQEELLQKVMGIPEYFSKEALDQSYNTTLRTYIIREDLKLDEYNITLFAALSDVFDSLYHLTQMPFAQIIPSNNHVYSIVLNSLNCVNIGLKQQARIFTDELLVSNNSNKRSSYILLGFSFVLGALFYLIISTIFFKVAKKKNDYLNIFFEISSEVIKRSLFSCELFHSKLLTKITHGDNIRIEDNDNGYFESDSDEDTTFEIPDKNNSKSKTKNVNNANTNVSSLSKSKFQSILQCSFEDLFVHFFLILLFGLICIILIIIIVLSNQFLDSSYYSTLVYEGETILQVRYLNLFNIFREFMFDENINVFYTPLKSEIETIFHLIYDDLAEIARLQEKYGHYCSKDYLELALKINNEGICDYVTEFFPPSISSIYSCSKVTYQAADMVSILTD